jgi:hypothetical protein
VRDASAGGRFYVPGGRGKEGVCAVSLQRSVVMAAVALAFIAVALTLAFN